MISFPIYSHLVTSKCFKTKINGEDGFPHSEIAGSKIAHISPTLIAACHVLHRLYMPRHPPNALTSRLRIHTTNNKIGTKLHAPCIKKRFAMANSALPVCADNYYSAFSNSYMNTMCQLSALNPAENRHLDRAKLPRHRLKKPIHNVKEGHSN